MDLKLEDRVKLDKVWDIKSSSPQLYKIISDQNLELDYLYNSLADSCPIPPTCSAFSTGNFFRLKGHARSFCIKAGNGVLIVKGTEPFTSDYLNCYQNSFLNPLNHLFSKIEGFNLIGHEIYLALSLKSALKGAHTVEQFVNDYYSIVNSLPAVSIPLGVFSIPKDVTQQFLDNTEPFLPNRSQFSILDFTQSLAKEGLGVSVSYYPSYPMRVAHMLGLFPFGTGANDPSWSYDTHVDETVDFDFKLASDRWVALFVNMLGVGYVPTTWLHKGNCMQIQNLIVDGGFHAVDSIVPTCKLQTEKILTKAILTSVHHLASSLAVLSQLPVEVTFTAVWNSIRNQIKHDMHQFNYDSRITELFNTKGQDMLVKIGNWQKK